MKKIVRKPSLIALIALSGGVAFVRASEQSWNGRISDSMCGTTHMIEPDAAGKKMSDGECVRSCVKDGSTYVFVSGGKVYPIENQKFPTLGEDAGLDVTVFGKISKDAIEISRIITRK